MFLGAVCRCATGCLAGGGHADGFGAAGGDRRYAGGLPALAFQKKNLTLCKRHLNGAFDRVSAIDDLNDGIIDYRCGESPYAEGHCQSDMFFCALRVVCGLAATYREAPGTTLHVFLILRTILFVWLHRFAKS